VQDEDEIPLTGGDVTEGLVRVGNTVRRPRGERWQLVRNVLTHLESVGFEGAPRFLGVDSAGREMLSYVDGEVAGRPRPPWIADEDRMISVAHLVRRYHDAVAGFGIPTDLPPPIEPPGLPHLIDPPELVGHQDITPENVVFRDGRAYALIDFDLARPVSRPRELVNLMLWWAPLGADEDLDPELGLSHPDRLRVMDLAIALNERAWHLMKYRAETLGGGWQRMWDEGVGDKIHQRQTWLERNADSLTTALIT
jgi:hypothetical protein